MENEENAEELDFYKLSLRQQKFIDEYIIKGNATKAAETAGYKGRNLNKIGSQNLAKLGKYIKARTEQLENERIASMNEVLMFLTSGMRGEEKDQFGLDPTLQDRIKCAELLGKRHGAFIEKKEISGGYQVELVDDVSE